MKKILAALCASMFLAVPLADAGTATGTLTVTASVNVVCTVTSPTLAFGTYSTAAPSTAQTDIVIDCGTIPTAGQVTIDGTPGARAMGAIAPATGSLPYEIYTDSGYANAWGSVATPFMTLDTTAASAGVTTLTVYGRIAAGETAGTGGYQDARNITVNY
jgi:spore coat protein U-like protein